MGRPRALLVALLSLLFFAALPVPRKNSIREFSGDKTNG